MKTISKVIACTTALTLGIAPNCLASTFTPVNWTISGSGTTNTQQVNLDEYNLSYNLPGTEGFDTNTWTISTVANADGDYTFDWNYTGFHSYFNVTAFLNTFNPNTTLYSAGPSNCCSSPSAGFNESGSFTFSNISAGQTFGFTMGGSHFDSALRLEGNLNLKQIADPVSVPENNSIVPLITLGLFGAYSTLRKKELQTKLTRV